MGELKIKAMIEMLHFYLTFPFVIALYCFNRLSVHQWESYWYAAGVEHLHNLFYFYLGDTQKINYYYHQHHPLFHFIVHCVRQFLNMIQIDIRAIDLASWGNTIFSLLALLVFRKLLLIMNVKGLVASISVLFLATADMYWYYSLSGGIYILPVFFLLLCSLLILKLDDILRKKTKTCWPVILIAVLYVLACASHVVATFFAVVILSAFIFFKTRYPSFPIVRNLGLVIIISTLGALFFYIYLLIASTSLGSFSECLGVLFHHPEDLMLNHSATLGAMDTYFFWKITTLFRSLVATASLSAIVYQIVFAVISCGAFVLFAIDFYKKRVIDIGTILLTSWLVVLLILYLFIIRIPTDDHWMFIICPLILFVVKIWSEKVPKKTILSALVLMSVIQVTWNFKDSILWKRDAHLSDVFVLANVKESMEVKRLIIIAEEDDNLSEEIFNEMMYMIYHHKVKDVTIEYRSSCYCKKELPRGQVSVGKAMLLSIPSENVLTGFIKAKEIAFKQRDLLVNRKSKGEVGVRSFIAYLRKRSALDKYSTTAPWMAEPDFRTNYYKIDVVEGCSGSTY